MIRHRLSFHTLFAILAIAFSVFTVGIPLVLSSCPMADAHAGRVACCSYCMDVMTPGIRPAAGSPCCRTVIAARFSTSEYVTISPSEHQDNFNQPVFLSAYSDAHMVLHSHYPAIRVVHLRSPNSYLRGTSLPILFSSLLI
jgi:hypothetical protein